MQDKQRKIRYYYHADKTEPTEFEETHKDEWTCVRGGWTGTVEGGDELTLHHAAGSSAYSHYTEELI